jgi:hypothetical protein
MTSNKTLLTASGILTVFVLLVAAQGAAAATSLPSYIHANTTIHGYKPVYYNSITVADFDNIKVNTTCWTTIWYRASNASVNASIIGASFVNAGGRILDKPLNLTGTNPKIAAARQVLTNAGLNSSTINSITTVWDLFVAWLQKDSTNSSFTITPLNLAKVDHALLIHVNQTDLKHILFASKGPYMLLAFDYDINNWAVSWGDSANVTAKQSYIDTRIQADVWYFWGVIGTLLKFFNAAATWLSGSGVPATATASAMTSSNISLYSNTATSDLQAFAIGWAGLAGAGLPVWVPVVIIITVAVAVVVIVVGVVLTRKRAASHPGMPRAIPREIKALPLGNITKMVQSFFFPLPSSADRHATEISPIDGYRQDNFEFFAALESLLIQERDVQHPRWTDAGTIVYSGDEQLPKAEARSLLASAILLAPEKIPNQASTGKAYLYSIARDNGPARTLLDMFFNIDGTRVIRVSLISTAPLAETAYTSLERTLSLLGSSLREPFSGNVNMESAGSVISRLLPVDLSRPRQLTSSGIVQFSRGVRDMDSVSDGDAAEIDEDLRHLEDDAASRVISRFESDAVSVGSTNDEPVESDEPAEYHDQDS